MPWECQQRLATFAQWPMPGDACSGISCFASKAAAAFFERSQDCVDDEVVCRSCGVKYSDWTNESPAAVHRVISPKCPTLNQVSAWDTHCVEQHHSFLGWERDVDVQFLQGNPFSKYLPDIIQKRISGAQTEESVSSGQSAVSAQHSRGVDRTPEQHMPQSQRLTVPSEGVGKARRVLFPDEGKQGEISNTSNSQQSDGAACPTTPSILDQAAITHPFKTYGGYNNLFAGHRLSTFPQPSSSEHQAWAGGGFVFREKQQDMKCVFCWAEVAQNGHLPRVTHASACPTCPFVMGFDVGNISLQQEKDILRKYSFINSKRQAALNGHNLVHSMKYPHFGKEEEREASFQSWPRSREIPPSMMAEAGLFYTGHSDLVKCFYCGVGLANWGRDVDVWETLAAVSPTCWYVISHKEDAFISQAKSTEVVVEVLRPGAEEGIGSPHLDTAAIKAALARGYTLPQIERAIVKYFCQTSRYPNEAILKAILKGTDENHTTICEQQQLVQQKDTVIQQKDTVIQQQGTQLQQKDTVIQQKDTQLEQKQTQLHRVMQEKEQSVQQLAAKEQELNQRLAAKEQELNQQLQLKDQQIQVLLQQVESLRADRHNTVNPPHDQQADNPPLDNLQANKEMHQSFLCNICMASKPMMIFLPCGHLYSCAECTSRLLQDGHCPVCRQDISEVQPAFVA